MKALKYLGIFLGVTLVLFLGIGLLVPSYEYSSTVVIHAPVEKCWSILHDTSRMKKWLPGFKKLTLKSGEHMQAGATYEIVLNQDKVYVMMEKLLTIDAPVKASYELTNEVMKSEYEFVLSEKDGQTEIINHHRIIGKNLAWKSILFLFKSQLKAGSDEQLVLLKLEVEAGDMDFD